MRLVIDANEIFSFFNRKSKAREIALIPQLSLYAPKFALNELQKYEHEIMKKFSIDNRQFSLIKTLLEEIILFVEKENYAEFFKEAEKICPDKNDIDYFALALRLNCPIWSEDKKLKEQNKIEVFSTKDLITKLKLS